MENIKPGDTIGPYKIVRKLSGVGGMSTLYEARVRKKYRDHNFPRRVALKIAKVEYEDSLTREADFLAKLDTDRVVRIFPLPGRHKDVFLARARTRIGWVSYFGMEYVSGGSLANLLAQRRRLPVVLAVSIGHQTAISLDQIHKRGIIHLDVKPANILFRHSLRWARLLRRPISVIVSDFGVARHVDEPPPPMSMATPEYMSPEQATALGREDVQIDYRADIFSLGVVLYEMLTGRLPFPDIASLADPDVSVNSPSMYNAAISPQLDSIVERALAKSPSERFSSVDDVCTALANLTTRPSFKIFLAEAQKWTTATIKKIGKSTSILRRAIGDGLLDVLEFGAEHKSWVLLAMLVAAAWWVFRPAIYIDLSVVNRIWDVLYPQIRGNWLAVSLSFASFAGTLILFMLFIMLFIMLLIRTRGEVARKVVARTIDVLKGVTKRLGDMPQRSPGKLFVIQGANLGREFRLVAQVVKVGRDPQFCDFALYDEFVSNPHFSIQLEQTQFFITDEGSANGTRLNSMPIPPKQRMLLQPDTIIEAGQTRLQFKRLGGRHAN